MSALTPDVRKTIDGFAIGAPVTLEDLVEIYHAIRPQLAIDIGVSIVIRGQGTTCDPAPLRIEVALDVVGEKRITRSIAVQTS